MKKAFLFAVLAVAAFALSGCNKTDPPVADPYTWMYTVTNDTDSEIVVSYDPLFYIYRGYGYGSSEVTTFTVAAGESKPVIGYTEYGDYNKPMAVLDVFASNDVIPFPGVTLDKITQEMWENELRGKMTVGDREMSHEVWLRKYWLFDEKDYKFNYTLTVTDELVAELAIESEPDPTLPQK